MSYRPGTVLVRNVPFEAPAEGKPDMRAYNEIEVVNNSPVQTMGAAEWAGQLGEGITIKPTSFGPVIDRPVGELQADYTIKSIPEPPQIGRQTVTQYEPGPTPEEQFQRAAVEAGDAPPQARRRTPLTDKTPEEAFAEAAQATVPTTEHHRTPRRAAKSEE